MASNIDIVVRLVDQASKQADKITSSLNGVSAAGKKMMKVGGGMTLGITAPLAAAGVAAIGAASDFEESLSKIGVVFAENAGEIEAWASTASSAFGLSSAEALTAAGTFGNLFSSMGVDAAGTKEMSQGLVELAADLASFNNIDTSVALEKLQSGMLGSVEPMQALGVNLNASAVAAKAASMGLGEVGDTLSEQDKIAARYALILEQTSLAQGDFAATSAGLANQQKIVKAELANVSAELGAVLLPIALELVTGISSLVSMFSEMTPAMQTSVVAVAGMAAAMGPLFMVIGGIATGIGAVVPVLGAMATAFSVLLSPIGLVVGALVGLTAVIFNIGGAGDAVAEVFAGWGMEGIAEGIGKVNESAATLVDTVKQLAMGEISFGDIEMPTWISDLMFWTWPELGIPDWIETLFSWVWPVLGPIAWIVRLMSWAWPTLNKPTWISSLLNFRWPGFPSRPGWLGGGGDDGSEGSNALPNNAGGTSSWRGGPTWVGERGPEIVMPPRGSQILTNEQSMAAAQPSIVINATVNNEIDIELLAGRIAKLGRRRGAMA